MTNDTVMEFVSVSAVYLAALKGRILALENERDARISELQASLDALGKTATHLEESVEYNAGLVTERDARIAELEAAIIAADADADALFDWAVTAEHNFRCPTRANLASTCTCGLRDDLEAHTKRIEVNEALDNYPKEHRG